MKQIINLLIVIVVVTIYSFNSNSKYHNIIGKWYSYSEEEGYTEWDIDSTEIGIFSHYSANLGKIRYKIENDTIYYVDYNYTIKILSLSDSVLVLDSKSGRDTLYRLNDRIVTYNNIDYSNDSIFNGFYHKFVKRAFKMQLKFGYITKDEYERIQNGQDTFLRKDEIIKLNRK